MNELRAYLNSLPDEDARQAFADRCGSSLGHLRNVMYGLRSCNEALSAALERESKGVLSCETTCPSVPWLRIKDPAWRWHRKGRPVVDVSRAVA